MCQGTGKVPSRDCKDFRVSEGGGAVAVRRVFLKCYGASASAPMQQGELVVEVQA